MGTPCFVVRLVELVELIHGLDVVKRAFGIGEVRHEERTFEKADTKCIEHQCSFSLRR